MISFNFAKKTETRKLTDSKLRDESTRDDEEDKDFVTSVQGTSIQGTKKKEVKKELVIPLIEKNQWRVPENKDRDRSSSKDNISKRSESDQEKNQNVDKVVKPSSIDDQAIQELLLQSNGSENAGEDKIPLLLQNQIPAGFEEDDNMDVSLRPSQSTLEDYDRVPIEEFGMALLRGMGWNKTEGIGLKNKQHVVMLEPQPRPKGLGLGASTSQVAKTVQNGNKNQPAEDELKFKIGAAAVINKGSEKGMYGRVEGFDEDNNRVILKLAINGKMSGVSKSHMTLVTEKEYKEKSKVLNNELYDEYKKKQDKEREIRESQAQNDASENRKRSQNDDRRGDQDSKKYKRDNDNNSNRQNDSKDRSSSSSIRNWVRPHLRVRFIDKKYKQGKFYEKKFIVDDVIEVDRFVLKSDSGSTLLQDINSSQVETVIPKESQTPVCVLFGKHKGKIGELVEKIRKKQTAVIRIPDGGVFEIKYDDICEFVGDPEDFY